MNQPPIIVSRLDVQRIEAILGDAADLDVADALEQELLRATLVAPADVPPDVVTMNSRVRCREEVSGREYTLTLVYPQDVGQGKVSVLAPVGAALLGLSVGQSIEWPGPGGKPLKMHILELEYQPEAEGDYKL
ncbi:nucleoside diphosphate kinase regulator [Alcanivorax quisquiliarum]|uniref:Nucleoside diphosphate kinase regulator n=1 Tax=Alcanivorax quisquiliarum TaxID=2933565 RepID=A0ABT0E5L4_9GAMM|nr:nucleoside diphosphate kinase regulator [Alcanivorax quisquiliarum]MCK0537111.1 nucleoside diphosphate kinase regulator [Alcanivorax quisquiliarum]